MQVVCGNCQLSFEAPAGAKGLVCPICRGPLAPAQGAADDGAASNAPLDWSGGTLDDLIAIMSGPALAVRVEVFPAGSDIPAGEVHLLAGGVSDAIAPGVSPNDALDHLRTIRPAHFHLEQRLPNPADGDLTYPGPDAGTLDARPLAHLMRYCEQFVITCSIDVWRGNENARVDYRKGEISGVTVGGIDAPERLAEVMRWSSGNYRLVVPRLTLPEPAPRGTAPAAAKAAKVEAPAPAPAPASPAPNRTIFGMPAADVSALRASVDRELKETRNERPSGAHAAGPAPAAPAPAPSDRSGPGTKTIFGVAAPAVQAAAPPPTPAAATAPPPAKSKKQQKAEAAAAAAQAKQERKTGSRKTLVPPPAIKPPAASAMDAAAAAAEAVPPAADGRATQAGFSPSSAPNPSAPALAPVAAPAAAAAAPIHEPQHPRRAPAADDETSRVSARPPQKETPIWTYVSVGFTFGLVLLGIYHLVGLLAH